MLLKHPEHPGTNWGRQKTKTRHNIARTIHTKVRLHTNTTARVSGLRSSVLPHSSPWTANRNMHLPKLQQLGWQNRQHNPQNQRCCQTLPSPPLPNATINCITSGKGLIMADPNISILTLASATPTRCWDWDINHSSPQAAFPATANISP